MPQPDKCLRGDGALIPRCKCIIAQVLMVFLVSSTSTLCHIRRSQQQITRLKAGHVSHMEQARDACSEVKMRGHRIYGITHRLLFCKHHHPLKAKRAVLFDSSAARPATERVHDAVKVLHQRGVWIMQPRYKHEKASEGIVYRLANSA